MINAIFYGACSGAESALKGLADRPFIFIPSMSVDTRDRMPNPIFLNQVNKEIKTSRSLLNRVCCLFLLVALPTSLSCLLTANAALTASIATIALIGAFYVNKKL